MIVVTGATGALGSAVVESLLTRIPAHEIGVSVRDAAKAESLAQRGIRVREASFDDAASLDAAFEGADRVLVISTDTMGEQNVARCTAAVDAAARAGVERVFYTSHMGAGHDSAFQACRDHAQVEDHLAGTGTAWTSLRNGFYAASAMQFAEHGIASGDIALPADGPVAWTTHRDLADAAAALLAGERTYEGATPPLTTLRPATFDDIAAMGTAATGHAVRRTVVDDEDFVRQMVGYGTPEVVARQLLGIFVAARNGEFGATDPALGEILGRTPGTVEDLVRGA